MDKNRRTIKHKREEEDQIGVMVKEDQANIDLEAMIKPLLDTLFARRTTMTAVITSLDNVPATRI